MLTVINWLRGWFDSSETTNYRPKTLMEQMNLTTARLPREDLQIRFAQAEDFAHIVELQRFCYQGLIIWDEQDFLKEYHSNPNAIYILLENPASEELVGVITGRFDSSGSHISHLMIHPNDQRQGLGKRLLEIWIYQTNLWNLPQVTLEVPSSNQKAIQLYRQTGFYIKKVIPNYYYQRNDDALYMCRPVN